MQLKNPPFLNKYIIRGGGTKIKERGNHYGDHIDKWNTLHSID